GGGKSWTLARLIEEVSKHNCKLVLLDATGEYRGLGVIDKHVHLGTPPQADPSSTEVVFPYKELTEQDFFAILRHSRIAQLPKLREAIRSLKLVNILGSGHALVTDGCIVKENQAKGPFREACQLHAEKLLNPHITIEITKLSEQITCECIYPTSFSKD